MFTNGSWYFIKIEYFLSLLVKNCLSVVCFICKLWILKRIICFKIVHWIMKNIEVSVRHIYFNMFVFLHNLDCYKRDIPQNLREKKNVKVNLQYTQSTFSLGSNFKAHKGKFSFQRKTKKCFNLHKPVGSCQGLAVMQTKLTPYVCVLQWKKANMLKIYFKA